MTCACPLDAESPQPILCRYCGLVVDVTAVYGRTSLDRMDTCPGMLSHIVQGVIFLVGLALFGLVLIAGASEFWGKITG
jgi:hypothetical protein